MPITTATTIASTGMPTTLFFGIWMKASGSELATTWPPPMIRTSMPRMMYSVASVTTRLGTRPMIVSAPFTTPHAMPIPMPDEEAITMRRSGSRGRWPNMVRGR